MTESDLPQRAGAPFTTAVFDRIGLDRYTLAATPVGPVYVGWTGRGVSAVRSAEQAPDAFARWYRECIGRRIVRAIELDDIARAALLRLADDAAAPVALDLRSLGDFERTLFDAVGRIERGYARPLDLLARDVGASPDAVRTALQSNPVPLLVPCHRVICNDASSSADYVFGELAQERLLEAEGFDIAAIRRLSERGVRYIGSADGSFCLPYCGDIARRAGEPGYVLLRSLDDALDGGFAACEQCRPVAA